MIRLILLITALLILPSAARADVYRNFIWGVSKEDVRHYETGIYFDEQEDSLFYLAIRNGKRILIRYDFARKGLWRIKVEYVDAHEPAPQMVLDRLMDEQRDLTAKFGKPVEEDLIWKNNEYRRHPEFLDIAYSMGDVEFRTRWEALGTRVRLESFNDGRKYQLFYTFEDIRGTRPSGNDKTFNFNLQP